MEPMVLGFNARNYKEALTQMQEWLDKQNGKNRGIKVEVKDNKTTVTLDDGRVGVARCNPCDKFDIVTGIRVALDDIEKKSRKLTDLELRLIKMAQEFGATEMEVWVFECEPYSIRFYGNEECVMELNTNKVFNWIKQDTTISLDKLLEERG